MVNLKHVRSSTCGSNGNEVFGQAILKNDDDKRRLYGRQTGGELSCESTLENGAASRLPGCEDEPHTSARSAIYTDDLKMRSAVRKRPEGVLERLQFAEHRRNEFRDGG